MRMTKLIINADDFGCAPSVSNSIAKCFKHNIINSTTMIVNLSGFEDGVKLAKQQGFDKQIGLHLNLTDGKSLTDLSGTGLTDENGQFVRNSVSKYALILKKSQKLKIKSELNSQYKKMVDNGIIPTHIDSHHHIHTKPKLVKLFVEFAIEKDIKLRIAAIESNKSFYKTFYKTLLNVYYKKKKVNFTDIFTNVELFKSNIDSSDTNLDLVEIMVHPILKDNNQIFDDFSNECLSEVLPDIICSYKLK